jgi:hypothetical protein
MTILNEESGWHVPCVANSRLEEADMWKTGLLRDYPKSPACRRAVTAQYPKAMGEAVIAFGTIVFVDLTPVS